MIMMSFNVCTANSEYQLQTKQVFHLFIMQKSKDLSTSDALLIAPFLFDLLEKRKVGSLQAPKADLKAAIDDICALVEPLLQPSSNCKIVYRSF